MRVLLTSLFLLAVCVSPAILHTKHTSRTSTVSNSPLPLWTLKGVSRSENGGETGIIDKSHTLMCSIENISNSQKPIRFIWKKNGNRIFEHRYTIVSYNTTTSYNEINAFSVLKINKVKDIDAAVYKCKATSGQEVKLLEFNLTVAKLPDAPLNLTVVNKSAFEITLSWSAPKEGSFPIRHYVIEFRKASDSSWTRSFIADQETLHERIINLDPSTVYYIRVLAANQLGESEPSQRIAETTHEVKEAEDESEIELDGTTVLKNLTCKTLDSQSIHLSWSAPPLGRNGAKLGYIVTYGTSDSWFGDDESSEELPWIMNLGRTSTEMVLDNLKADTNYMMRVKTFMGNTTFHGHKSPAVSCHTDQDLPGAPLAVEVSLKNSSTILVRWEPPSSTNGVVIEYNVYFKKGSEKPVRNKVTTAPHRSTTPLTDFERDLLFEYTVENIEEKRFKRKEHYMVWVTASTTVGEGEASEVVFIKTPREQLEVVKRINSWPPTEYLPRSNLTDQLNQAFDDFLHARYCHTRMSIKPLKIKVRSIAQNLKIEPWTHLAKESQQKNANYGRILEIFRRFKSEEPEEADAEYVKTESEEDDEFDDLSEEDVDVDFTKTEDQENFVNDDDVKVMGNFTQQSNGFSFSETPKPLRTFGDKFEYNFQLRTKGDLDTVQNVAQSADSRITTERPRENKWHQRKGMFQQRSKRPNAKVKGFQKIRRIGDIKVSENVDNVKVFDVPIQVGPIRLIMKKSADYELRNSSVTSPILTARLRLMEKGGQIVFVRIKPMKIHRNRMIVTYVTNSDVEAPSRSHSGRLVTYLSRQMAGIWNSGYLSRRIERNMKKFFKFQQRAAKMLSNY